MTARPRFLFDADFTAPTEEPPIAAAVHRAALAEAEARGYQRGVSAAEARERTEAERRCAAAFERIGEALKAIAVSLDALERQLEAEAVEVAFAVARKLAAELVAREPFAEIAALASGCLGELRGAPHVAVRIHDSMHDIARERLDEIARAQGFEGRLVVLGEADIAPGDCRVEWADGGAVRDRAAIEAAICDTIARYVAARRASADQRLGDGNG